MIKIEAGPSLLSYFITLSAFRRQSWIIQILKLNLYCKRDK
ncbi:MAG: hypothetical protein QXO71_07120 [Candidatus Jordarchaeaceae archaeon]